MSHTLHVFDKLRESNLLSSVVVVSCVGWQKLKSSMPRDSCEATTINGVKRKSIVCKYYDSIRLSSVNYFINEPRHPERFEEVKQRRAHGGCLGGRRR